MIRRSNELGCVVCLTDACPRGSGLKVAGVQKTFSRASICNTQSLTLYTARLLPAATCLDSACKTRFVA